MMKFNIGETIIEPTNGICTMEGMRRMKVDGQDMTVYIFSAANAKVYVPADQIERRNIRRPMSREDVKKVLASLKQPVSPNREDARLQYNNYREIMKSGDPMKIARLLRDLYILAQSDDLKGKEKEIMDQAMKFLLDEICYIRQCSKNQVQEAITESLKAMYKKKMQKDKEKAKKSGVDVPMGMLGYESDEEEEAPQEEEAPARRKASAKAEGGEGEEKYDEDEADEEEESEYDEDEADEDEEE